MKTKKIDLSLVITVILSIIVTIATINELLSRNNDNETKNEAGSDVSGQFPGVRDESISEVVEVPEAPEKTLITLRGVREKLGLFTNNSVCYFTLEELRQKIGDEQKIIKGDPNHTRNILDYKVNFRIIVYSLEDCILYLKAYITLELYNFNKISLAGSGKTATEKLLRLEILNIDKKGEK